jgi:predicted CxxxxCH...CXXCH cytochrome family protein
MGNVTSFSADLWEGAAYYVAVQARNDYGSSDYSNVEYFIIDAPPVVETGQSLYDSKCAGCHAVNGYDASGSPDLAAKGSLVAGKFASSHNGQSLTAAQQTLMATFLNQYSAPPTGSGSCTSCHGQPPTGSSSPNQAGSHGVHTALNGIDNDCASCHTGAAHNSVIDRGIISTWNAKSGAATGNSNGTCSNISCHGGVTTPNWSSGSLNVDTQCSSCHTAGTSQYNSYNSGEHNKHVVDKKIACTQCHDTNLLRNGHFSNLETSSFELAPSATIKSSIGYSGGRCSTASCHGSEDWND